MSYPIGHIPEELKRIKGFAASPAWSLPFGDGGPAAAYPITFVERGFTNDELFLDGVVSQVGGLFCVYVILFSDGSITPTIDVTYGGTPMTDTGFGGGYTSRTVLSKLFTLPGINNNSTVNVTEIEPGFQAAAIYVWQMMGATTVSIAGDDSHDAPFAGPISCPVNIVAVPAMLVMFSFQQNEALDGAAYTAGATPIRSDSLIGGVDTGRGSLATFQAPIVQVYSPGRVLKNPPRAYFAEAIAFK